MKIALIGIIGLLAGIIAAKTFISSEPDSPTPSPAPAYTPYTPPPIELPLDAGMEEMREAILATRVELNAQLEIERDRVSELTARVNSLTSRLETTEITVAEAREDQGRNGRGDEPRYNAETFVNAGLSTVEADRIIELEAEAQVRVEELLETEGRDREAFVAILEETASQIRLELGDYGYEIYLEATGRPTSVPIREVEAESAGAVAGLQEDDQIISYAGRRVFNISELQSLTQSGNEGDQVIVEVLRDDQTVTVRMPRGEIGISTRNNRNRR